LKVKNQKTIGNSINIIVKRGILRIGSIVVINEKFGKIKAIHNFKGEPIEQALPSQPCEVFGLPQINSIGEYLIEVSDSKEAV